MTGWNPNAEVEGLEWFPTDQGARIINAASKAAAMKIRALAADDIETVYLAMPEALRRQTNNAVWMVEVFGEGNEIPGAVTTATYRANAVDTNVNNSWVNQAAATLATANVVAAISETDLDATTYAQYRGTYADKDGLFLEFNTNSASGSPDGAGVWGANRRIVGGRLRVVANRAEASGRLQFYFRASGGGNYAIGDITVDTELREFVIPFPSVYPPDSRPWGESVIQDLDGTASIRIKPVGVGKHKPLRIFQLSLELDYVTENRESMFVLMPVAGSDWVECFVVDPTVPGGATPWTTVADTTYTLLLRRFPKWRSLGASTDIEGGILEGGQVGWRYLAERAEVANLMKRDPWLPDGFMASYTPVLNPDGTVAAMGEAGVRGYGVVFLDDAAAVEDWGQPYERLVPHNPTIATVNTGVGQTFTAGASDSYVPLRFIAAPTVSSGDTHEAVTDLSALADLVIKVKRESTDVQVGSTVTITGADLADYPEISVSAEGFAPIGYFIEVEVPGLALTSGVQYYVEFISDQDEFGATQWGLVSAWTMTGTPDDAPGPTFGGATETAITTDGSVNDADLEYADMPLTVAIPPDAPADFAVVTDTQTIIIDVQAQTPDWLVREIEYASMTWAFTSLADDFVAYEIQRSHDAGVSWESIFWITDEAVTEARDYEARRNIEASYRMRVHAAWHTPSTWTDTETATMAMADCALLFVSNEDPTVNQGYVDIGGSRSYTFLSADERTTRTLVGRSYQIVTAPLEYRGDQFEVTLALWAGSVPEDTGRARFDPIAALNNVATSYVCVLDETGRRWLADVAVSEGVRQGQKVHEASARITELTDTPSLVDVEV